MAAFFLVWVEEGVLFKVWGGRHQGRSLGIHSSHPWAFERRSLRRTIPRDLPWLRP